MMHGIKWGSVEAEERYARWYGGSESGVEVGADLERLATLCQSWENSAVLDPLLRGDSYTSS